MHLLEAQRPVAIAELGAAANRADVGNLVIEIGVRIAKICSRELSREMHALEVREVLYRTARFEPGRAAASDLRAEVLRTQRARASAYQNARGHRTHVWKRELRNQRLADLAEVARVE